MKQGLQYYKVKIPAFLMLIFFAFDASAQSPSAGFSSNITSGCAPLNVAFSNSSQGATNYLWDFGNGNTSSNANPSNVYLQIGTYQVRLIAIDQNGNRDTLIRNAYIQVLTPPTASFSIQNNNGCAGSTSFQFTNTSQNAATYFWDFGDGTFSTQANPVKTYTNPGNYNISLLATNDGGCNNLSSQQNAITVNPKPNTNFLATPTQTCNVNQVFQFNAVNTTASSYFWDFGDGTTSTQQNPSKTYNAAGNYNVKLKVTSQHGCIDSLVKTDYIKITSVNSGNISVNNNNGCRPFAVNFSTNFNNALTYQWNFGNSQTSSAANPSHTYQNPGSYNVSVFVTFPGGCSNTFTLPNPIVVNPEPIANFTVSNNVGCAPLNVQFNNTSQNAETYTWSFLGTGFPNSTLSSPMTTYNQPGSYNVRLTATNEFGCSKNVTLNNIVQVQNPVVNFTATPTNSCPPQTVDFTANVTGNIVSYLWDFGDGNTSTLTNPSNLYTENGSFDVTLTVTNGNGCSQTHTVEDYINLSYAFAEYNTPDPIVGCSPLTVSYDVNTPGVTSYLWDFGDGTTSTSPSPIHAYTSPGTYQVSLLVEMANGCSQFYPNYHNVIVEGRDPLFSVTIDPCPPYKVQFHDNGSEAVAWFWEFGDGSTSTEQNPSHIYENTLIRHVTLTTTTASGCSYSYIGFNAVNFDVISATFTASYTNGPFPQTVQFTSTNPQATSWVWDFGDGNSSTEENPIHTYQIQGDYVVTLTINSDSCFVIGQGEPFMTLNDSAEEEDSPGGGGSTNGGNAPQLNPLNGCRPLTVHFFKTDTSHTVLSWDFGDGSSSTAQQPAHTYDEAGLYTVTYQAQTPSGIQTVTYAQAIRVGGFIPEFDATPVVSCSAISIQLIPDIPWAESWKWNYSGTFSEELNHTAVFSNNNSAVNVTLTTKDSLGCVASRTKSVFLSNPNPVFDYNHYSCDGNVSIQHNIAENLNFFWDMGDGNTSTDIYPSHTYTEPGLYNISLKLIDTTGCEKTYQLPNTVRVTFFSSSFQLDSIGVGCVPFYVSFQNSSIATGPDADAVQYKYLWSDGISTINPYRNITTAGTYSVQLIAFHNLLSCNDTSLITNILVHDAVANFNFEQSGICLPITAQFTDQSVSPVSWLWEFGNDSTSTLQHPSHLFETAPNGPVSLTIVNVNGCTATKTKPNIYVFNANFSASATNGCNPLTTTFSTNAEGVALYEWDFGDGTTSNQASPTHLYQTNGTYTVTLTVTSFEGCVETLVREDFINVHGPISNFFSPTPASCAPSIVEFIDQSENAASWSWDFGDGSFSSVQNPVKLYNQPGSYNITLITTSENGCVDTLMLPGYTTVLGPATNFSVDIPEACANSEISFTDNSLGAVSWEWNFGEGTTSNLQHPSFVFSEPGSYTVSLFSQDSIGCTAYYILQTPIIIHVLPIAVSEISEMSGCTPFSVQLSNLSEGANIYHWDFGNGANSVEFEPEYTYTESGLYDITLIVENEYTCRDTTKINDVHALLVPMANFGALNMEGCTPVNVQFQNNSQQIENAEWNWIFGNGETSNQFQPSSIFTNPGVYDVSLTITNANGCMDSVTNEAMIFVYDTIAPPSTIIGSVSVLNETSVIINWEQTSAEDFAEYKLFRYNQHTGSYDQIAVINNLQTNTYTDHGLQTLVNSYCYKVLTVDRCGYALDLNDLVEHCTIDISTSTQPNDDIIVNWTPYIGRNVNRYRIFRTEENATLTEDLGVVDGSITTFTDTTLICPVKYRYSVKAEQLDGLVHLSSDSDYDIATPIRNLFENQQVTIGRSTVINNEAILTEWAQPEVMGQHVTAYRIFRSEDNENFYPIATVPSVQTAYVDEFVNINTTKHFYRIMAINSCGLNGLESNFSDNIVLKAWMNDLFKTELEWTPYLGWDSGVSFYIIEKQSDNGDWKIVKFVGGNVTNTVDEN